MSNRCGSLAQLTIIIPSYERQAYLSRQIAFWAKYDVNLELLDGSAIVHPGIRPDALPPNIHYWHMPVSIEQRFSFAINRVNTEFAALLSDDEFFIPSAVEQCISEMLRDEEYVSCKGQSLWFDWNGTKVIGGRTYANLRGYVIDQNLPAERMRRHMASYEMATLWSIQRAEVFKRTLIAMSFDSSYRTAAAGEMQTSLVTAYSGKCRVIDHLMWLRSQENENIWWSFGRQSIVEWFRDDRNSEEHARFLNAIAIALEAKEDAANIHSQILKAVEIYVTEQEEKFSLQQYSLRNTARKLLGQKGVNWVRGILNQVMHVLPVHHQKFADIGLTEAAKQLVSEGIPVDFDELEEISLLIRDFHTAGPLRQESGQRQNLTAD